MPGLSHLYRGADGTVQLCPPPLVNPTSGVNPVIKVVGRNNGGNQITGDFSHASQAAWVRVAATAGNFAGVSLCGDGGVFGTSDFAVYSSSDDSANLLNRRNTALNFWVNGVKTWGIVPQAGFSQFINQQANTVIFIGSNDINTGTGAIWMQAGAGSLSYGGTLLLFAASSAVSAGSAVLARASGSTGIIALADGVTSSGLGTVYFQVNPSSATIPLSGRAPTAATLMDMTPDQGTFTATLTGFATPPTATAVWTRIGNLMMLTIPAMSGTSNAAALTITGLPTICKPARTVGPAVSQCFENSGSFTTITVSCTVSTAGVITFFLNDSSSAWASTGGKGYGQAITICYPLN